MNYIKELEGQEIWTNAFSERFGERICVLVKGSLVWNSGKTFKPTRKEAKQLWDDHIEAEFGSKEQMMRDLELEFGVQE